MDTSKRDHLSPHPSHARTVTHTHSPHTHLCAAREQGLFHLLVSHLDRSVSIRHLQVAGVCDRVCVCDCACVCARALAIYIINV